MSLGPSIKPLDGVEAAAGKPASQDAQKLARAAGEFESMLLLQMLREMRKSGSWKEEGEDKDGYGAETLFDTLDIELSSYLTKAQGMGLEASLVKQITGRNESLPANGLPSGLPSLDLPTTALPAFPTIGSVRGAGSSDKNSPVSGAGSSDPANETDATVTSKFGWRRDPFSGVATYHRGVDLRAAYGESIGAADAGTVVFAGEQGGYGQTVVVEHGDGVRTRYAHLSALMTQVGAEVKAGEPIGRAGRSGRATGTHLHFEVTQHGRPIDPQTYSPGGLKVEGVVADWRDGTGPTLPGDPQRGAASE